MTGHVNGGNYNFVFDKDGTARKIGEDGFIERVGVHPVRYSLEEIVKVIREHLNNGDLQEGLEFNLFQSFKFEFEYKYIGPNGEVVTSLIEIRVPTDTFGNGACLENFNELEKLCKELIKVKEINEARIRQAKTEKNLKIVKVVLGALAVGGVAFGIAYGTAHAIEENIKEQERKNAEYIEEVNEERKENDLPPVLDNRLYNSWDDYYAARGQQDSQDDIIFDDVDFASQSQDYTSFTDSTSHRL